MIVSLVAIAFAGVVLQALGAGAARELKSLNAESVELDKQIAGARSEFSRLVGPDVLAAARREMFPAFQNIKIGSKISLGEIPGGAK